MRVCSKFLKECQDKSDICKQFILVLEKISSSNHITVYIYMYIYSIYLERINVKFIQKFIMNE